MMFLHISSESLCSFTVLASMVLGGTKQGCNFFISQRNLVFVPVFLNITWIYMIALRYLHSHLHSLCQIRYFFSLADTMMTTSTVSLIALIWFHCFHRAAKIDGFDVFQHWTLTYTSKLIQQTKQNESQESKGYKTYTLPIDMARSGLDWTL